MKKLVMEFLGTFFFIFTIAMTGSPWAIATMLMAWVYIGGYVSGAHYNPMISLAVALTRNISWAKASKYMIIQVLAGFAAFALTTYLKGYIGVSKPGAGVPLLKAFIVEVLLSFVLALVVLMVAHSEKFRANRIFGLAIGFTIPALATLGGPISGGLFNPAIALGSALFGATNGIPIVWENIAMYLGGAFLGGFLAAWFFNYFMEDTRYEEQEDRD